MSSVTGSEAPDADATAPDLTARARIRDAAIEEFGTNGVAGTSLRAIADRAGVSQPLILHHFDSKQGLRAACDHHVAQSIRAAKLESLAEGQQLDPLAAMRRNTSNHAALRYLARTVADGSPEISNLIDEMIEDALEYEQEGIRTGLIKPSRHPRERMVVLMLWQLGLLMLHEELERLVGVDLFGDADQMGPYMLPIIEMLSEGVLPDDMYERTRQAFASHEEDPS